MGSMMVRLKGYAREAKLLSRLAALHPSEAWVRIRSDIAERSERAKPRYQDTPYIVEEDWERRFHEILGAAWPCEAQREFWPLWDSVLKPFRTGHVSIGRGAFDGWGDGEPAMTRAVWCLVRHVNPEIVIETGVARGFTTRMILEGLERNGTGHLYSIDLPPPLRSDLHEQIGTAVRTELRHRWSYLRGSSRRHLPRLLATLRQIDLFIHDSAHSEYNTFFELTNAWSALKPGGVVIADDIDYSLAFHRFPSAECVCASYGIATAVVTVAHEGIHGDKELRHLSASAIRSDMDSSGPRFRGSAEASRLARCRKRRRLFCVRYRTGRDCGRVRLVASC
jgi:Methyltransferase domain